MSKFVCLFNFEAGFHCVVLAVLELATQTMLATNSDLSAIASQSGGIKGVCQRA